MRLDLFSPGDSVLLLGEGDFSFAVELLNHRLPIFIIATCFERELSIEGQGDNIRYLEENGKYLTEVKSFGTGTFFENSEPNDFNFWL